ncbi:MAG: hypothetical protein EOO68_39680, partial [Moraxellaceae bacterium]
SSISSNHNSSLPRSDHTRSVLIIVAVIIIGLIILLGIVYWLGKQTSSSSTSNISAQNASSIPTPTNKQPTASVPTQPVKKAIEDSAGKANFASQEQPAPANQPVPEEKVADLYQQNDVANLAAQQPKPDAQMNGASPTSINHYANLQEIGDLPNGVLERIPSLNYTEHNYNVNGGNVVINGNVKHINDQLSNGLVIDKILEDGMILHFENYAFKMRALNSWVNM